MATYTSSATGLWSAGATWVGGVKPPSAGGHKIIIANTHNVTYDEASSEYGDDTTSAFTVNSGGTLTVSKTMTTLMKVKGHMTINGTIDYGTSGAPVPNTYTATLTLNYYVTIPFVPHGISINTATSSFYGATKTINTTLYAGVSAGATSFDVVDGTGWIVGDTFVLATTDGTYNHYDKTTISTITLVSGTRYTITCPALTYAHAINCPVGMLSHSVILQADTPSTRPFAFSINTGSTFKYVTIKDSAYASGLSSSFIGSGLVNNIGSFSLNSSGSVGGNPLYNNANLRNFTLSNVAFFSSTSNLSYSLLGIYGNFNVDNCVFYFCASNGIDIGSYFLTNISNCTFCSGRYYNSMTGGGVGGYSRITDCKFHTASTALFSGGRYSSAYSNNLYYYNCYFGSSDLYGTPSFPYIFSVPDYSFLATNFIDCKFGTPATSFFSGQQYVLAEIIIKNKNQDVTLQEKHSYKASITRENSVIKRSKSSIRIEPLTTALTYATHEQKFLALNGVTNTIVGYLRKNAAYGASTLPYVQVTGLGITPVTFTMTNSTDTWEKFTLSVTQSSGADGELTFTYYGQSANASAYCYLDGVATYPFITFARHYGYKFDTGNMLRVVDPIITQTTEATVAGYTGISIAGTTITITSNHSIQEIYDYAHYYMCENLGTDDFFTSTDGINFTSTYNLTLNGGNITGTGNINLGTKTLTVTAGETTTCPITYDTNTKVYGNITITGLVANSRVYLNNTTDNVSLYNAVVAGTSVSIPTTWTANKNLTLRVTNVIGATAYMPYESLGTLTSTMAQFTVVQESDTVYNSNAISGSTVTYFSTDYPNLQVDISSGTTFTVQEMYAWYQYATHTSQGIVYYFGGITAQDQVNYVINTAIIDLDLDNTSGHNINMTGGYVQKDDHTSYIYSLTANSIIPIYDRAYIADSTQIQNMTNLIPGLL